MCDTVTSLFRKVEKDTGNEEAYYQKARAYIRKNYTKAMNVSDVADAIGISYAHLSRVYKNQAKEGETLLDYLNTIRVMQAKKLLAGTDLSLQEIAEKVGYNNTQSLQRFFKKYEHVTPGEYRKMSRG